MHRHAARPTHAPALVRSGLTATGATLLLAGLAGPAAAQDGTPAPAPADDTAAPAEETIESPRYEVAPGDSLSRIADAHGLDPLDGWRLIFDANPDVIDPNLIVPGQLLVIPPPDADIESRALPAAPVTATPAPRQDTPVTAAAPVTEPPVAHSAPEGVWDRLAQCESGGNWQINTGNGYYGGLQFLPATWHSVGGTGLPHEHSRDEQIRRGQILQERSGWGQWPACSRRLGLR